MKAEGQTVEQEKNRIRGQKTKDQRLVKWIEQPLNVKTCLSEKTSNLQTASLCATGFVRSADHHQF